MTSSFAAYLARRVLSAIAFVMVVSVSALVLTRLTPGYADIAPGPGRADIVRMRAELGLDRPVVAQVFAWMTGLAHLDLGGSLEFAARPVKDLVVARAVNTAELAALALTLATIVGVPVGLLTGARPRGVLATLVTPLSIALVACPPLVGTLALLLLALKTGWLSTAPGHVILPALALALPLAATLERVQSQATAQAMAAPDLIAAAARGIPPARLLWIHAARQSLQPLLGIYGLIIGSLLSGSLAVEVVTGWPGLGQLLYLALRGRDLFLVAGCALLGAVGLAAGNLMADAARALVDPRVRTHG